MDDRLQQLRYKILLAERNSLETELSLRKRSGSASERLHNLCEGISKDADGSEWSREEWERLDAENASLRAQIAVRAQQVPLTDEQIDDGMDKDFLTRSECDAFAAGVRFSERSHGITPPAKEPT
jgi:hypothetical protein